MDQWGEQGGLNRTSVGLKLRCSGKTSLMSFMPQSNQRGVETFSNADEAWEIIEPQSNQRGVETVVVEGGVVRRLLPQSNQRGVETWRRRHGREFGSLASIEPAWG